MTIFVDAREEAVSFRSIMSSTSNNTSAYSVTDQLAAELRADIQRRALSIGDRYYSTTEAAKVLGVSRSAANRAILLLVDQGWLVRREGAGTVVGEASVKAATAVSDKTVHIMQPLMHERMGITLDELTRGIHLALPDASTQINIFRADDPFPGFRRVVETEAARESILGMGILLAPREVQEIISEFRIPAVVIGTPWPDMVRMSSIDVDYDQLGDLAGDYLVGRDHRRIGILLRDRTAAGDCWFLRRLMQRLGCHGLPLGALDVAHVFFSEEAVHAVVRQMLHQPDPPTVLLAPHYASVLGGIARALRELPEERASRVQIVTNLSLISSHSDCPFEASASPMEIGELFGKLLAEVSQSGPDQLRHLRVPVHLKDGVEPLRGDEFLQMQASTNRPARA